MNAKDFNDKFNIGDSFTYKSDPVRSKPVVVIITSMAWEENGETVVEVQGKSGCLPIIRFSEVNEQ